MALPTRDGGRRGVAVALATTVRWLIVSPTSAERVNIDAVDRAHRWCLAPDRVHWGSPASRFAHPQAAYLTESRLSPVCTHSSCILLTGSEAS